MTEHERRQEEMNLFCNISWFLDSASETARKANAGNIEIADSQQIRVSASLNEAADMAYDIIKNGRCAYYGINPRLQDISGHHRVEHVSSFHAEIPFGKGTPYKYLSEVIKTVTDFTSPGKPSIVVATEDAVQCIWFLKYPVSVEAIGVEKLIEVNLNLASMLCGDPDKSDIGEFFCVPAYNQGETPLLRLPDVALVSIWGKKYMAEDFGLKAAVAYSNSSSGNFFDLLQD